MNNPRIYSISRNNKDLGPSTVRFYIVSAVLQALVIFYVPYFSLSVMERFGTGDVASFGIAVFWIYWFIMNWSSIFLTRTWTFVRPLSVRPSVRPSGAVILYSSPCFGCVVVVVIVVVVVVVAL